MVSIPQKQLDRIQPLNRIRFERMKDTEFRPGYDLIGLKYLRDKAGNERNLRELYRGRAPYELLQNADDAGANKAVFILSAEGLAFAHDGDWFTVENFRSLADGWSDKDPNQCIGHKGLGFRSVLDITPAPYLLKAEPGDFFGVKFTWALNNGHIQETLHRQPDLRAHYETWTRQGQLCCPVMAIPGLARKQTLGAGVSIFNALVNGDFGSDFTTMFWFPARDPDISPAVLSELSPVPIVADEDGRECLLSFMADEVSVLLPFLASVQEVRVHEGHRCIALAQIPPPVAGQKPEEITVLTELKGKRETRSFFRMIFVNDIPPSIRNLPDTPKAVKRMERARLSLLVCLENGQPVHNARSAFHVYFPTEELTGLGFVVHADFYVKPDRTRIMKAGYNDWLLGCAAKAAANEFLTRLLLQYRASSVFEALSPVESIVSEPSALLRQLFGKALQERQEPFVPTNVGLLGRDEVLLPPAVDVDGFWETHFPQELCRLVKDKKAFLAPTNDGRRQRAFLSLADVDVLQPEAFIDFVEVASTTNKDAHWWYECYKYMVNEETLSRHDHSFFAGRKLIPGGEAGVVAVPTVESDVVVTLPPIGTVTNYRLPPCFAEIFVLVDNALAQLLQSGEDTVRNWVLDRFHISRFEATELLPRAIRRIAPQIFAGELKISRSELIAAWRFIKAVTDASRMIKSAEFWQDMGRFPLPLRHVVPTEELDGKRLVPAFLAYWPDSWVKDDNCLWQVEGLRRVDESFLYDLLSESKLSRDEWHGFFSQLGVADAPKLLTYSRIVAGDELLFEDDGLQRFETEGFKGVRQSDMNSVVVKNLQSEQLWSNTVASVAPCGHGLPWVAQTITVLEGLQQCAEKALQEFAADDPHWRWRLWALAKKLPLTTIQEINADSAFCRGGGGGGHSIFVGRYIERQLDGYPWLPTSLGPVSSSECFLRFVSRRLISSGLTGEELGDKLLPYVVVDNIDDLARLQGFGVEILDDVESASPAALIRCLVILGERLASNWGQQEILKSPSRWRLLRGAIQEIYRRLNQYETGLGFPDGIKYVIRSPEGVKLSPVPIYYADPGSAIEQAFIGMVPLIDADRPYARLFEQIPVTRLLSSGEGKTVEESLVTEGEAKPLLNLRDEIVNKLAPFLLAPIVAKSEKQKDIETIVRRLRERFEVKACDRLTVSFSLIGMPGIQRSVDFPRFYLQRRIVPREGAVEEAHYILYVAGSARDSVAFLDADALGQELAPIFFVDRVSEDLAGLFPRIAYRYQQLNGKLDEMRDFLHYQLGISREAQDSAMAIILGDVTKVGPISTVPPLPVKIITPQVEPTEQQDVVQQTVGRHQQTLSQQLTRLLQPLASTGPVAVPGPSPSMVFIGDPGQGRRAGVITAEQQNRGKRGEEEIKRRLQLPGGWAGFSFVADKREEDCGYDFLCAMGERQVQLEVKTFTIDGRVVVTVPELRAAAASRGDYYLVGVLDDGKPESEWHTFIISNPIEVLLSRGDFDIEATLHASASDIFGIDSNG
ncbi:DUF3883 domain-containing protein [Dehalococcoidia bacterium]|nr:DUF3883 domain-containing protein [Dehalococcoidia bacterium]